MRSSTAAGLHDRFSSVVETAVTDATPSKTGAVVSGGIRVVAIFQSEFLSIFPVSSFDLTTK